MSYCLRSVFALLAFMGMVGVASAATYSWPLAISVPVTVSYPNPPPGFTVRLYCSLAGLMPNGAYPILGAVATNVPYTVSGGVASYNGTMNLSVTPNAQGNNAPPVTGNKMSCRLTPGPPDHLSLPPPSSGQRSVSLTLP